MKVIELVSRSLRVMSVIDRDETPEAKQAQDAIIALNGMMRRWEANGIPLGWSSVETGDEDIHAPDEALDAITYNLAVALRPEYGIELGADVYALATENLNALRRDVLVANPLNLKSRLNRVGRFNMITDEYEYRL